MHLAEGLEPKPEPSASLISESISGAPSCFVAMRSSNLLIRESEASPLIYRLFDRQLIRDRSGRYSFDNKAGKDDEVLYITLLAVTKQRFGPFSYIR